LGCKGPANDKTTRTGSKGGGVRKRRENEAPFWCNNMKRRARGGGRGLCVGQAFGGSGGVKKRPQEMVNFRSGIAQKRRVCSENEVRKGVEKKEKKNRRFLHFKTESYQSKRGGGKYDRGLKAVGKLACRSP